MEQAESNKAMHRMTADALRWCRKLFIAFQTILLDSSIECSVGYAQFYGSPLSVAAVAFQGLFYHLATEVAQVQALGFFYLFGHGFFCGGAAGGGYHGVGGGNRGHQRGIAHGQRSVESACSGQMVKLVELLAQVVHVASQVAHVATQLV